MTMNIHALRTLGALAAIGGSSPALADVTQTDGVLIDTQGFSIGGDQFASGAPTNTATLEWDQAWFGVVPTLSGYLYFDGVAGNCARVRIISYGYGGAELDSVFSDQECVHVDGIRQRAFELQARYGAAEVKVTLQTLGADQVWRGIGSRTIAYGPDLGSSSVLISAPEFDLGSGELVNGAPEAAATVTWTVSSEQIDNGITPALVGSLYLKNAENECARVRSDYKDRDGDILETIVGVERCAEDDRLHKFPIRHEGHTSSNVVEVTYTIETRLHGGTWADFRSASVRLY